jgi:hypothetical protein
MDLRSPLYFFLFLFLVVVVVCAACIPWHTPIAPAILTQSLSLLCARYLFSFSVSISHISRIASFRPHIQTEGGNKKIYLSEATSPCMIT